MKKACKVLVIILMVVVLVSIITACKEELVKFENLTFSSETFLYDGLEKTIFVTGVPNGATVTYAPSNVFTEVGEYEVTATISSEGYETMTMFAKLTIKYSDQYLRTEQINALVSSLQSAISSSSTDNKNDIATLRQEYESQVAQLMASINSNNQAIVDLRSEYLLKVMAIESTAMSDKQALVAQMSTNKQELAQRIDDVNQDFVLKTNTLANDIDGNKKAIQTLTDSFIKQLADLVSEDNNLKNEIDEFKNSYAAMVDRLDAMDEQIIADLAALSLNYNAKTEELEQKISDNKEESESLESELNSFKDEYIAQIKVLLNSDESINATITNLSNDYLNKVVELQQEIDDNFSNIEDLQKEITEHKTAYDSKIIELTGADSALLKKLDDHINSYVSKIALVEKSISDNKAIFDAMSENYEAFKTDYIKQVNELVSADSELLYEINNVASDLENLANALNERIASNEEADLLLKKDVEDLTEAFADSMAQLIVEIARVDARVDDLTSTHKSDIDALNKSLLDAQNDYNQKVNAVNEELNKAKSELEQDLSEAISGLQSQIDATNDALEALGQEHATDVELLTEKYDQKVDDIMDLISLLQSADATNEARIAELEAQVAKLLEIKYYTILFNSNGGSTVQRQTVQEGAKVVEPTAPTKNGYTFSGWYVGEDCWSFVGYTVTSDIVLEAKWLDKYDLSDIAFEDATYVYDGSYKSLEITGELPTGLSVNYYNNTLVNVGSTTAKAVVVDASGTIHGEFSAKLTIEKANIGTITMSSLTFTYDGTVKSLKINEELPVGVKVTYLNNYQVNAGSYEIIARFTDNGNYNPISEITAILTINKAEVRGISFNSATYTYDSTLKSLAVVGDLPSGASVTYTNNSKSDVGSYTVKARIDNLSDNYVAIPDMSAVLTINKADVTIVADNKTSVYGETLKELTYSVSGAIYNNDFAPTISKEEGIRVGSYDIVVSASHSNYNVTLINGVYSIVKDDYDVSNVVFNNATYIYDGSEKSIAITGDLPEGVVAIYENNTATNAGTYIATVNFMGDSVNFNAIPSMSAALIINKATYDTSGINFENKTYVYDGTEKTITIDGVLPIGLSVSYASNTLTKAGKTYAVASFSGDFDNYYTVAPMQALLTVDRANYDLAGVTFDSKTYIYDGTPKTMVIDGNLPEGVSVSYDDNIYTLAGSYTVTATFKGDYANYYPISAMRAVLKIDKATYDMSNITFEDKFVTYNGKTQTVVISGDLPEGVSVEYFNNEKVNAGEYYAIASFTGDSDNYNYIDDMEAILNIAKADYDLSMISFDNNRVTYNGGVQALAIVGNLPEGVTVTYLDNENVEVGTYTVTARFIGDTKNYNFIPARTATITIEQATPELNVTYTPEMATLADEIILVSGTTIAGSIVFDEDQIFVLGTKNYRYTFTPEDTKNYKMVKGSITIVIYAKVTFVNEDGSTIETQYLEKGDYAEEITPAYEDNSGYSYEFDYWTCNGEEFDFNTQIIKDVTLVAKYTKEIITYTITYITNGGISSENLVETYTINDTVSIPALSKSGYTFNGWSGAGIEEGTNNFTIANEIGNRTFVASFTANTYTVNLNVNGGECDVEKITVTYDQPLYLPTPTLYYHSFVGWYYGSTLFVNGAIYKTASNITLKAKWEIVEQYEIYTLEDLKGVTYYRDGNFKLMRDLDLAGEEWVPLGDISSPFSGMFDGNGHTISNFIVSASTSSAGLFGANSGTIKNLCVTEASITNGSTYASLFVGYNKGLISYCSASGNIDYSSPYMGGITAYQKDGSITYSSSAGTINNSNEKISAVGGLVGYLTSTSSTTFASDVDNSNSTITLTGVSYAGIWGGLIGQVMGNSHTATISRSYYDGKITNDSTKMAERAAPASVYVGGLIGDIDNAWLSQTFAKSKLCYSGTVYYSNISTGYNEGKVGGLIGYAVSSTILNSFADVDASIFLPKSSDAGYDYFGGLVGYLDASHAANCYAVSTTTSDSGFDYIKSMIGSAYVYNDSSLTNCFASNNSGNAFGSSINNNCYYYSTSLSGSSNGAVSTTLANLQSNTWIRETLGWDDSIWTMRNGSYPTLALDYDFLANVVNYTFVSNCDQSIDNVQSVGAIKLPVPTREGYVFYGWFDNEELLGTAYHNTYYSDTETMLFAKWVEGSQSEGLLINDNNIVGGGRASSVLAINMPIISNAFYSCDSLTSVVIGDSATSIGERAFEYCSRLTSVVIGDSVTSIGSYAFSGCSSLTSVVIGDSVTSIKWKNVFYGCSSLTSVVIGDSVTSIGESDFENFGSLTNVVIGNSVTSIGNYAFKNCDSLTSVVIGNSVTGIGDEAFRNCSSLTSVYYNGDETMWNSISIRINNSNLTNATRYYYSETKPTVSGNYWHYVDGVVTVW